MLGRLLGYVLVLLAVGRLGWGLGGWLGACVAMGLTAVLWQALTLWSSWRMLEWLRRSSDEPLSDVPRGLFGAWREVAQRLPQRQRQSLRRLADANQALQDFLDAIQASPNGVIILDSETRIEWMNGAACAHFGLHPKNDLGQHVLNLVREPLFTDYLHQQMDSGAQEAGTGITLKRWRHAQSVLKVQLHPYGQGKRLMLSQDFTAIAQAEAMQRDFVANVSHEIRTPLTVLTGFIETMQSLPLDETKRTHYLDLMARQAKRQQALISDLLTLSRLEGRSPPGQDEQFGIEALMAECATEATALSLQLYPPPARPQVLQFDALPDVQVRGSRTEWHSACINLINNAVRYSGEGGSVRADWTLLPDGQLEFAVQDSGSGIAPEHLTRLSERFYRVDGSRSRDSGGTGLGLAITRQVAQRHDGQFLVESTLGKGSRFALRLPAKRVVQSQSASSTEAQ